MADVVDERVLEAAPATTTTTTTTTTTEASSVAGSKGEGKQGTSVTEDGQREQQQKPAQGKRRKNKKKKGKGKKQAGDEKEGDAQDTSQMEVDEDGEPVRKKAAFAPVNASETFHGSEMRSVSVPQHRYTPLKESWNKIFQPIVEHMKLQIRMNVRKRRVELRTCKETERDNALQKAHDFVKAFMLGFDVADAVALLRLDDLYLDSFDITDVVRRLSGDHLSRAVGRIAGKGGKTKFTIENATKTRIVVTDTRVHILGAFDNIREARHIISKLIIGSPPSKIHATLQSVSQRLSGRF